MPIETPATFTFSPGSNDSTVTVWPTSSSVSPRNSTRWRCGRGTGLLQVAELAAGELALGDRAEGELDGVVPVRRLGTNQDDRAGPGLDHRHGVDGAGLLVEDLRHAELPAEDALHRLRA